MDLVDGNTRLRNDAAIGTWSNHFLSFKTNSASCMIILPNGNIGVGSGVPVAKFQVKDGDIFIEDINRGNIMKSPDGNCWRGTLNNQGQMEFNLLPDCVSVASEALPSPVGASIRIAPNPANGYFEIFCSQDE
jgi:hypothetical protein